MSWSVDHYKEIIEWKDKEIKWRNEIIENKNEIIWKLLEDKFKLINYIEARIEAYKNIIKKYEKLIENNICSEIEKSDFESTILESEDIILELEMFLSFLKEKENN